MDKIKILTDLEKFDIKEEFISCFFWLKKYLKDFENTNALEKAYSIWEKNMALRHWIRTNTLKPQYQLWIGKNVKASQKIPKKGNKVVFTKEKDAYTWSSSKRYAVSCIDTNNKRNKGSYLVRVHTTKDDVIFDVFGLSKLRIDDSEKDQLIEAGFTQKQANLIKELLDDISQEAFKEIIICNDVVNQGIVSAVWDKDGNDEGNWRVR
jgi:hypothetical protein